MRVFLGLFLAIAPTLLTFGSLANGRALLPHAAQARVDGRAIVGEWIGLWKSAAGSSGHVHLSVEGVDGDQARGRLFVAVAAPDQGYYNRALAFSGSFDGADLYIWVPPGLELSLKVNGRRMRGKVQAQHTFGDVELDKRE